jgi:hypothetical protein
MTVKIINWTESDGKNPLVLFDNFLKDASVTPSAAEPTQTESTYDGYEFTLNQTITFDLGAAKEYYAFAVVGHSGGSIGVQLFSSTDNSTFTAINSVPITIDGATTTLFVFNKRNTRYFGVQFTGSGSRTVRNLLLGSPLEMDSGVGYNYTPIWLAQEKELLVSKTLNGQFVGNRVMSKGAMTDVPLLAVERPFVEEDLQPFFNHYNDGKPFIFASGPTVFDKDVAYVWRQQNAELRPTFDQSGNFMSLTMSIEGYVQ